LCVAGTGFNAEERGKMGLDGLLPARVENIDQQAARYMAQLAKRPSPIDKFLLLNAIKQSNVNVFYRMMVDNIQVRESCFFLFFLS